MSADNYAKCPSCAAKALDESKRVISSYGHVSKEEYDEALKRLNDQSLIAFPQDLREDFEIGIVDGEFYYSYSAHCSSCGFSYKKEDFDKIIIESSKTSKGRKA